MLGLKLNHVRKRDPLNFMHFPIQESCHHAICIKFWFQQEKYFRNSMVAFRVSSIMNGECRLIPPTWDSLVGIWQSAAPSSSFSFQSCYCWQMEWLIGECNHHCLFIVGDRQWWLTIQARLNYTLYYFFITQGKNNKHFWCIPTKPEST